MPVDKFGCGPCTPSWMQKLANPKLFVVNVCIITVLFHGGNTYINSALTIIERQFKLSGLESGALASVNDVAIICVVVFGSYFGHKSHRPRWIAAGSIICAIGNLLCTLPHFLSKPGDTNNFLIQDDEDDTTKYLCDTDDEGLLTTNETSDVCQAERGTALSVIWLVIGQILIGAGSGFYFPLVVTYVEDAVGKTKTLSYTAFVYLASLLGGIVGYLISSFTNSLYVDFDRLKPEEIPDIPQNDTRWIGAWWLGFIINALCIVVFAIPVYFFPQKMANNEKEHKSALKIQEEPAETKCTNQDTKLTDILRASENKGLLEVTRGLLPALKRVCSNATLWCLLLAVSCVGAISGGGLANLPKFLVYQFNLSISTASLVIAAIIPLLMISHFLSAFVMRKLQHDLQKSLVTVAMVKALGTVVMFAVILVKCPTPDIAGFTVPYHQNRTSMTDAMIPECYADCSCMKQDFFPVCGSDGITYTSPCFAGCSSFNVSYGSHGNETIYEGCSCISEASTSSYSVTPGFCKLESKCYMIIVSLVLIIAAVFTTTFAVQPVVYIVLRICDGEDRAVALGLLSAVPKIIGLIPAPIYFGAVINTTCRLWEMTCGVRGNCWLYDVDKFRYYFFGLLGVLFALDAFFTVFAWCTLPSAIEKEEEQKESNQDC